MEKYDIGFVAIGQAGGNIGFEFEQRGHNGIYINTAVSDTKTLPIELPVVALVGSTGTAKNQQLSAKIFDKNIDRIFGNFRRNLKTEKIIFVIYSTSGGTGGGMGNKIAQLLSDETDKTICRICTVPDMSETLEMQKNALNCCKELTQTRTNGCTFIVNNANNPKNLLDINANIVDRIETFIEQEGSMDGNIDDTEMYRLFATKGYALITHPLSYKETTEQNIIKAVTQDDLFCKCYIDKKIREIGFCTSKGQSRLDTSEIYDKIGTPTNINMSYDTDNTILFLTGMTYPYNSFDDINDTAKILLDEQRKIAKEEPLYQWEDIGNDEVEQHKTDSLQEKSKLNQQKRKSTREIMQELRRQKGFEE